MPRLRSRTRSLYSTSSCNRFDSASGEIRFDSARHSPCESAADQCLRIGDRDTVELSKQKRTELQRINAEINTSISYVGEQDGEDDWKLNPASGDCEDFAVTKRQRLLRAGWPSGALRIATARTTDGIGHAVLVVSTSQGDLVLDNRTNVVKPWKAVDLKWIKIQSHEDPRVWLKL